MNAKSRYRRCAGIRLSETYDMNDPSSFAKLVPGFEFMQGLVKNAGAALPGIGQWVAPTIDPAELEKRIEELRTVQFWLEQNARMLAATIQALEVQRMTLSTLKTMNVQMEDLRDSLQIRMPGAAAPAAPSQPAAKSSSESESPPKASSGATGPVDPLQWWTALTKQFTELATTALKDTSTDAARGLAGAMVNKSFDAASQSLRSPAGAESKTSPKGGKKASAKTNPKPAASKKPKPAR
jgi:hypothetical protein